MIVITRSVTARPEDIFTFFREAGFNTYSLENDYTPLSYLAPNLEKRPKRVWDTVDCESDVVFSRRDAEFL
jgi:hypothetical protein